MRPVSFHWEAMGERMARVLKALGDVNRMKIIKVLASNPDESVCVSDMADIIGISQPATSQHIAVLRGVDLLVPKRAGNRTYYRIDPEKLMEYRSLLDHMFRMVFVRCEHDGRCESCPARRDCDEQERAALTQGAR